MSEGPNIGFQFPHFRGLDTKQASEQAQPTQFRAQGLLSTMSFNENQCNCLITENAPPKPTLTFHRYIVHSTFRYLPTISTSHLRSPQTVPGVGAVVHPAVNICILK